MKYLTSTNQKIVKNFRVSKWDHTIHKTFVYGQRNRIKIDYEYFTYSYAIFNRAANWLIIKHTEAEVKKAATHKRRVTRISHKFSPEDEAEYDNK